MGERSERHHEGTDHESAPAQHEAASTHRSSAQKRAAAAAVKRIAQAGQVTDLGKVGDASTHQGPAEELAGAVHQLRPGDSLRFEVAQNQILNIGTIGVQPKGAATVTDTMVEPFDKTKPLGHAYLHQFTVTVSPTAKPGSRITARTTGGVMSHNPEWAFQFHLDVIG